MKKVIATALVLSMMATTTFAQTKEHTATNCAAEIVAGTVSGSVIGAGIGITSSILLAPLTGGTSLLALPTFGLVGIKGGAIYGAAGGTGYCVVQELNEE